MALPADDKAAGREVTLATLLRLPAEASPGSSCTAAMGFAHCLYPAAHRETQTGKEILLSLRLSDPWRLGKERRPT